MNCTGESTASIHLLAVGQANSALPVPCHHSFPFLLGFHGQFHHVSFWLSVLLWQLQEDKPLPFAELWMGDHPSGPARVQSPSGKEPKKKQLGQKDPLLELVLLLSLTKSYYHSIIFYLSLTSSIILDCWFHLRFGFIS